MKNKIAYVLNTAAPFMYGLSVSWSILQYNAYGYAVAGMITILFVNRLLNKHYL